jgi:hypothetical protein
MGWIRPRGAGFIIWPRQRQNEIGGGGGWARFFVSIPFIAL